MKGDRELCMAAVVQNGKALEWVSEDMKENKALVLAAARQMNSTAALISIKQDFREWGIPDQHIEQIEEDWALAGLRY